jgi:hypothetical protein
MDEVVTCRDTAAKTVYRRPLAQNKAFAIGRTLQVPTIVLLASPAT